MGGWVRVRFYCCGSCEIPNRCGETSGNRKASLAEPQGICIVCCRPIWDAEKGTPVYQTLNYEVTPETIPDVWTLDVGDINWTITPPLPSGIGHTPQPKQPKLSGTPGRCTTEQKVPFVVQEQSNETIGCEQDEQTDLLCDSLADMSLENRHLVQELISIFPDVAKNNWMLLGKGMTGVKP